MTPEQIINQAAERAEMKAIVDTAVIRGTVGWKIAEQNQKAKTSEIDAERMDFNKQFAKMFARK